MKRFSLCFAVAFVLFSFQGGFSKPTQSQLDSLEALQPVGITSPDTISYDKLGQALPGGGVVGDSAYLGPAEYRIGVRFTVPLGKICSLQVVYFQIDNSYLNTERGCSVWVYNDANGRPDTIPRVAQFVEKPLPNSLRSTALGEVQQFGPNASFWVVLGPVPGGPLRDSIGDGWWGLHDLSTPQGRSFIQFETSRNTNHWDSLGDPGIQAGNWVIRAGVRFIDLPPNIVVNEVMFNRDRSPVADTARNHEWVELYNAGDDTVTTGATGDWKILNGLGDPANSANYVAIRNGIKFPPKSYLVIHINLLDSALLDTNFNDGRLDVYVSKASLPQTGFFGDRVDACALYIPGFPNPSNPGFASLISWNLTNLNESNDSYPNPHVENFFLGKDSSRAVRIVPQNALGPLLTAGAAVSVGRDSSGTDSSRFSPPHSKDIDFLGGPHAAGPTMGRRNVLSMVVDDTVINANPVQNASWTLMLYFAADNGDSTAALERWCYDLLNQIEEAIPPSIPPPDPPRKVNVVVQFDSRQVYSKRNPSNKGTVFRGALRHDVSDTVRNLVSLGEKNTGNPGDLAEFITWARDTFPATQYMLAFKGDGAGWQGLCGDRTNGDRLEMNELTSAFSAAGLNTSKLDLLVFDAPLMSQVEVAAQVKDFAHFMVASPEVTGPSNLDYARLTNNLDRGILAAASPQAVADELVVSILEQRRTRGPGTGNVKDDKGWMWVGLQLDSLHLVLNSLNLLATNLKKGVEDICAVGDATDNFQLFIQRQLRRSKHYGRQAQGMADFVDLKWFCRELRLVGTGDAPPPPACNSQYPNGTLVADSILNLARVVDSIMHTPEGDEFTGATPVLISQSVAKVLPSHFGSAGLSIYFPTSRQRSSPIDSAKKDNALVPVYDPAKSDHPFDAPGLGGEIEGGVFGTLRMYARDTRACYPHAAGTCVGDTTMAYYYPRPVVQDFKFVNNTQWDELLIRYYTPVADAGGPNYGVVNVGVPRTLDGSGSSDADDNLDSNLFFWDIDTTSNGTGNCLDFTREDLDKNCQDSKDDDLNYRGKMVSASFQNSGPAAITLHVWDNYDSDKDTNTLRRYQTAKATAQILVTSPRPYLVDEWDFSPLLLESNFYERRLEKGLIKRDSFDVQVTALPDCGTRTDRTVLGGIAATENPIYWQTGLDSNCLLPGPAESLLVVRLNDAVRPRGVWLFSPRMDEDSGYQSGTLKDSINKYFGVAAVTTTSQTSNRLHLAATIDSLPVFQGLDTNVHFPINLRTSPSELVVALNSLDPGFVTATRYPLLKDDNNNVVAVAIITEIGGLTRGRIFSSFGLEHIAPDDSTKLDTLLTRLYYWMFNPQERIVPPCPSVRGDLNGIGGLTAADVVLELNCAFLGSGSGTVDGTCNTCFTDVNCDTNLTAADVVLELNRVFLGETAPPWCGP